MLLVAVLEKKGKSCMEKEKGKSFTKAPRV